MLLNDGTKIQERGFLYGYSTLVWIVISMQAFGGLLVAVVVKYADNILKGFAASFSIIVSCIVSVYIFSFTVSVQLLFGTFLVILAIFFAILLIRLHMLYTLEKLTLTSYEYYHVIYIWKIPKHFFMLCVLLCPFFNE